jgi:S-DNA-T family DNA segregation ATPase FtsK/SpoIIIE
MKKVLSWASSSVEWKHPAFSHRLFAGNASLAASAADIEAAFQNYGLICDVRDIDVSASISTYKVRLLGQTTLAKVKKFMPDIALSLGVDGIRFVGQIPGTPYVGLEIANAQRTFPVLDNFNFEAIAHNRTGHPVFVGIDNTGSPRHLDLGVCPHMLVAGTTGSGKSVFINTLLCSLLKSRKPSEVGLVLIDPKQVEFGPYANIPHLKLPVATTISQAYKSIHLLVEEMEARYSEMSRVGASDLTGWYRAMGSAGYYPQRIFCVIDEFADLILTNKEIEQPIVRLAQKGRAAGIHLVIATQRPVATVVTGLIKANIPTRVAFRVSSGLESRIILDQMGAEKLLGKGDALISHPEVPHLIRVQAPLVTSAEINSLTDHWRAQARGTSNLFSKLMEKIHG